MKKTATAASASDSDSDAEDNDRVVRRNVITNTYAHDDDDNDE